MKWIKNPYAMMGDSVILDSDTHYVSYSAILNETVLAWDGGPERGQCEWCLEGDHRAQFEKVFEAGLQACKDYCMSAQL